MNPTLKAGQNTGVIIKPLEPTAWVVSGETGIVPVLLEQGAQFDLYLPDEESQGMYSPIVFDGENCVTFSATNNLEILINRLRALGQMPATHEAFLQAGGYVSKISGKVNFSDRFTGKMSGTTKNGNNLGAVAESIRTLHGVLPETDWPVPAFTTGMSADDAWSLYYAEVPQELQTKAKKFLDYFQINYQWIAVGSSTPALLKDQLKYGPMQIASQVCLDWGANQGVTPIHGCGCTPGHATTVYGYDNQGDFKDFDSYKGYRKLLAADYCIPYALQYTLGTKVLAVPGAYHHTFNINLAYGMAASDEVKALQMALQALKDPSGSPYMKAGVFGPYGPATKAALAHFQADHAIVDDGSNFGPRTRAAVNKALNG